jgi:hypothetical protein
MKKLQANVLTSGLRFATRIVHLSFVPVIPEGKFPPKAASIAAALLLYNSKHNDKYVEELTFVFKMS